MGDGLKYANTLSIFDIILLIDFLIIAGKCGANFGEIFEHD